MILCLVMSTVDVDMSMGMDLDLHQGSGDSYDDDNDNEPHTSDDGKHLEEQLKTWATTTKKALAVLSLFAGVAGMVITG